MVIRGYRNCPAEVDGAVWEDHERKHCSVPLVANPCSMWHVAKTIHATLGRRRLFSNYWSYWSDPSNLYVYVFPGWLPSQKSDPLQTPRCTKVGQNESKIRHQPHFPWLHSESKHPRFDIYTGSMFRSNGRIKENLFKKHMGFPLNLETGDCHCPGMLSAISSKRKNPRRLTSLKPRLENRTLWPSFFDWLMRQSFNSEGFWSTWGCVF